MAGYGWFGLVLAFVVKWDTNNFATCQTELRWFSLFSFVHRISLGPPFWPRNIYVSIAIVWHLCFGVLSFQSFSEQWNKWIRRNTVRFGIQKMRLCLHFNLIKEECCKVKCGWAQWFVCVKLFTTSDERIATVLFLCWLPFCQTTVICMLIHHRGISLPHSI